MRLSDALLLALFESHKHNPNKFKGQYVSRIFRKRVLDFTSCFPGLRSFGGRCTSSGRGIE